LELCPLKSFTPTRSRAGCSTLCGKPPSRRAVCGIKRCALRPAFASISPRVLGALEQPTRRGSTVSPAARTARLRRPWTSRWREDSVLRNPHAAGSSMRGQSTLCCRVSSADSKSPD